MSTRLFTRFSTLSGNIFCIFNKRWINLYIFFFTQDTNPIFLFSKSTIEAATPPSPSVNYGSGMTEISFLFNHKILLLILIFI